jgi:sodium/bile acid cotransporter 7
MARLIPDRFVLMILAALLLGWLLPVRGSALSIAQDVIFVGVFLLFFLHGLRLPHADVANTLRSWRVQGAILGFTFLAMPAAGWLLAHAAAPFLPAALAAGLIYVAILPSTVQSAISYSSIGGGNVAASVVAAAFSNLVGIVLTPLLAALLLNRAGGAGLDSGVVIKIATMLLLPFALGQLAQRWLAAWAARQRALLSFFDRGIILLAVYIAFAGAVASGALSQLDARTLLTLAVLLALLLAFAFGGTFVLGRACGFERANRVSLIFAGAHKSIATGAPMAAILFGADAGVIVLPAVIYHMAQLILSAPLSARLAKGA